MSATILKMAARNLMRNKTRNIATGIAISCGFAAFIALGGYRNRAINVLRILTIYIERVGHVVIYAKDGLDRFESNPLKYSFNEHDQRIISEVLSSVSSMSFYGGKLFGTGLISNGCTSYPFFATAYDPAIERKSREIPEVKAVMDELNIYSKGKGGWNYPTELGGIALAEGLVNLLGKPMVYDDVPASAQTGGGELDCADPNINKIIAGDANVQLVSRAWDNMISAVDGEIVANFKTGMTETNSTAIVTSLEHLQKLYDTPNVTAFSAFLNLPDPMLAFTVRDEIEQKLREKGLAADVYTWSEAAVSPFYASSMGMFHTLVGFISCVLVSIIAFSIFNSATMTVVERSQEIGMMRALGFTRSKIRAVFMLEAGCLAMLSILVGAFLAFVGVTWVNHAAIPFQPAGMDVDLTTKIVPDLLSFVVATVIIFGVVLATTLLAVRTLSRQNIVHLIHSVQR